MQGPFGRGEEHGHEFSGRRFIKVWAVVDAINGEACLLEHAGRTGGVLERLGAAVFVMHKGTNVVHAYGRVVLLVPYAHMALEMPDVRVMDVSLLKHWFALAVMGVVTGQSGFTELSNINWPRHDGSRRSGKGRPQTWYVSHAKSMRATTEQSMGFRCGRAAETFTDTDSPPFLQRVYTTPYAMVLDKCTFGSRPATV